MDRHHGSASCAAAWAVSRVNLLVPFVVPRIGEKYSKNRAGAFGPNNFTPINEITNSGINKAIGYFADPDKHTPAAAKSGSWIIRCVIKLP